MNFFYEIMKEEVTESQPAACKYYSQQRKGNVFPLQITFNLII